MYHEEYQKKLERHKTKKRNAREIPLAALVVGL